MLRREEKEIFVKFESKISKKDMDTKLIKSRKKEPEKFKEDPKRLSKILKIMGLGIFAGIFICLMLYFVGLHQTFADIFAMLGILGGLSATTGWVVS